jgi:UDP-glucose 4-epimerase
MQYLNLFQFLFLLYLKLGYIGSHAVLELIKEQHNVIVFDNLSSGFEDMVSEQATLIVGDIRDKAALDHVFKTHNDIDVVMLFAAIFVVPESVEQPLEYYSIKVEGVRVLLESMKDHNIKNIVFSSTAAVYGEASGVCFEEDETRPINPYGETKLATERMIKWVTQAYGMKYLIFRYFNVAGADQSLKVGLKKDQLTHLIPVAIQALIGLREKLLIYGDDYDTEDGTCVRDYIHVSDLAYAHVLGAKYLKDGGQSTTINLGSNQGYSVLDVAKTVQKLGEMKYQITERRPGDPAKLIASNEKAKTLLHWEPKYGLEDIVNSDFEFRKTLKK